MLTKPERRRERKREKNAKGPKLNVEASIYM